MYQYDIASYCTMIADEARMNAYTEALREAVTKDSIVLDLGSGTGIFSFLACKFGAKKVYSVEPNALIYLSKNLAKLNDCAEKIEFIEKLSTDIELPEKADILICDLHGTTPFFEASIASIIDARKRLLKPNAVLIPKRETVYFAIVQGEEVYQKNISRHLQDFQEIKMSLIKPYLTNRLMNIAQKEVEFLSNPQIFAELDYQTIEETSFSRSMSFVITKDGIAHGLRGWFECRVAENRITTNSQQNLDTVYGAPFFPFEEPIQLKIGDKVEILLKAVFQQGEYSWFWHSKFYSKENSETPKAEFQQSILQGLFISPKILEKRSEYFIPKRNDEAEIHYFILSKMNAESLNGDIAEELQAKFPEKFPTFEDALEKVGQITQIYSL